MKRGMLRVYIGYAPGVGKTVAMLDEGERRKSRGADVVVGYVEGHDREAIRVRVERFQVVPRCLVEYQGRTFEEMDVAAILARKPEVVLVDELAHTNVPGSLHQKRWQDVNELLDAGIVVITTLNIQHLESLQEAVEQVTGVQQRETIPDHVLRQTDQIEMVDISPWALRQRIAQGGVFDADKVDAALGNYFRESNLTRLRELAVLWLADQVEDALQDYMDEEGINEPWETRERVLVALSGRTGEDRLIRRATAIAKRRRGELVAVHVTRGGGLKSDTNETVEELRSQVLKVGGRWRVVDADDISDAVIRVASDERATQLVVGASRSGLWENLTRGSVTGALLRGAGQIDVHVIASEEESHPAPRWFVLTATQRRQLLGAILALVMLPLITFLLTRFGKGASVEGVTLLSYITVVVLVAATGGAWPAFATAVVGFLLADYYFIASKNAIGGWDRGDVTSMVTFLVLAALIGGMIVRWSRSTRDSRRVRIQADGLLRMASAMGREEDALGSFLDHLRVTFSLQAISILRLTDGAWASEASLGDAPPRNPSEATNSVSIEKAHVLATRGPRLRRAEREILTKLVPHIAVALRNRALKKRALEASRATDVNELRGAILNAVSHDLRNPLSAIKAAATSLIQDDVTWPRADADGFLETIESETDRLIELVANLLDASRVQTGVVAALKKSVRVEKVIDAAIAGLDQKDRVITDVSLGAEDVLADPSLLERALANVIQNALKWSPPDEIVRVFVSRDKARVELRVVDKGPGIPEEQRQRVFEPFERLDSQPGDQGVGLGLAVARGFIEVMGGRLAIEDTPGGGASVVMSLEAPV